MNLEMSGASGSFQDRFAVDWWDKLEGARQDFIVITEPARSVVSQTLDWLGTPSGNISLMTVGLLGLAACVFVLTRKGNGAMKKQSAMSDIFLEAVDLAYIKGQITRTERRRLYKQLAEFFKATDLLNKKQNTARLKGLISHRLGNGVYKQNPKIPGDPPFSIDKIIEKQVKIPVRNRMTLKSKVMRTQPA